MKLPYDQINVFYSTGENAHLSNFAIRPFTSNILGKERLFQTVEGAFQASKLCYLSDMTGAEQLIAELMTCTGSRAKQLGQAIRGLDIKAWDSASADVMHRLVLESFQQNPSTRDSLLATGQTKITHCKNGVEQDGGRFSRVLMAVRAELSS